MKKKYILVILLFLVPFAILTVLLYSDGRRRQADVNMLSGVVTQYFENEYSRFEPIGSDPFIKFPADALSDEFLRKIVAANFPHPIWMLNLSRERYMELSRSHSISIDDRPQVTPLVWSKRQNFGRIYYVYWGVDGGGVMSEHELEEFTSERQVNDASQPKHGEDQRAK